MMWNHGEWTSFGMGFGWHWIIAVLFWGLVIWGAIVLMRSVTRTGRPIARGSDSALDVLKTRYARGELKRAEYERMRKEMLAG